MKTFPKGRYAAKLAQLARAFEEQGESYSGQKYTCNAIDEMVAGRHRDYFKSDLRRSYAWLFDLPVNEGKLWDMAAKRMQNIRVLMLCFLTAMAEAGDIPCLNIYGQPL